MAYLIIASRGTELDRMELAGTVDVGRASDCGIPLHDILLSRKHCRFERAGRGWVIVDLHSKNGTWLDGERVGRRGLRHGDVLRVGKIQIHFMGGPMPQRTRRAVVRPADPFEALASTVADFECPVEEKPVSGKSLGVHALRKFPAPRPEPRVPDAYARDDVYGMLSEIASSSWDSIYAEASRPTRPLAKAPELPFAIAVPQSADATLLELDELRTPAQRPATPLSSIPTLSLPTSPPPPAQPIATAEGLAVPRRRSRRSPHYHADLSLQFVERRPMRPAQVKSPVRATLARPTTFRRISQTLARTLSRLRAAIASG